MSTTTAQIIRFPLERRQAHRLVSLAELQEHFGYSERWWRYRLTEGMPRRKWGSRLRFNLAEVEAWLDERYGHGTEAG
jgi:predicted DNA-binding transcriptional regulator AlpA